MDASEVLALARLKGLPPDGMEDLAAGRARIIPLTLGKFAVVDASDFDAISQNKWFWSKYKGEVEIGYAARSVRRLGLGKGVNQYDTILMHRVIMSAPKGIQVDHKNMIRWDNRKSNLRLATFSENVRHRGVQRNNSTGFTGVYFNRKHPLRPFSASIVIDGKLHRLGHFETITEAAEARRIATFRLHGEFASHTSTSRTPHRGNHIINTYDSAICSVVFHDLLEPAFSD